MTVQKIRKIVLFGAGNVASSLAPELVRKGFDLVQVYNRSEGPGASLALKTGAGYCSDLAGISKKADLYIFAVSDHSLPSLLDSLDLEGRIAVTVSGTMDTKVFKGVTSKYGAIYPVQTFSRTHPKHMDDIPICVEGNSAETQKILLKFAGELTGFVFPVDMEKRRSIHLAAVIANNFPTYLYSVAENFLDEKNIPYDILFPLIRQTARNASGHGVSLFQTGPAVRGDREVMETQIEMLKSKPEMRKLYQQISENIIKRKKRNDKL